MYTKTTFTEHITSMKAKKKGNKIDFSFKVSGCFDLERNVVDMDFKDLVPCSESVEAFYETEYILAYIGSIATGSHGIAAIKDIFQHRLKKRKLHDRR